MRRKEAQKFRVDFYFLVSDMAIRVIDERFVKLQHNTSLFGFLYYIYSLKEKPSQVVLNCCKTLKQSLTHGESTVIKNHDLAVNQQQ